MEIGESAEDLASEAGKFLFIRDMIAFQRTPVHELEEDFDFAVTVVHVVALDDVRVVNVSKDLDLTAHLTANRFLVIPMDHLQGEEPAGQPVDHLVNGTSASASDSVNPLQLLQVDSDIVVVVVSAAIVALMVVVNRRSRR